MAFPKMLAILAGVGWLVSIGVTAAACPADCDGDERVVISELMLAASIARREYATRVCPPADANRDGRIGIDDLIAAVAAALGGCPPPTATATPTHTPTVTPTATGTLSPTPIFDPQVPPTNTVDLLTWLQRGFYREWRQHGSFDGHDRGPVARVAQTFINDDLYASLTCYDVEPHPVGASAVVELRDPRTDAPLGWSVSHKVLPDSDGGRGWYWYDYFAGSVRAAGRGVAECSTCHEVAANFGFYDYFASVGPHGYFRPCLAIPESDGGVCTELGLPPLATPYDGEIETPGGATRPATLYTGSGIFLEGAYYYSGSSGTHFRRYCASSVPRRVLVDLELAPDGAIEFAYYSLPSEQLGLRFRGRRRDALPSH